MIERYRESWITDFLDATLGDWTGSVLMLIAVGLCTAFYYVLHLPLTKPAASKEPEK